MWEIIATSFENVVPLFAVVFVGYALRCLNVLDGGAAEPLNALCFRLLLPCLCIRSLQAVTFDFAYLRMALYIAATYAVAIPALCVLVPRLIPRRGQAGAVVQAAFRSNVVMIGIPLMQNICGADNMGPILIGGAETLLLFNFAAVIVLGRFSEKSGEVHVDFAAVARSVARNPVIIGTLLGILLRLLPITLPALIAEPLDGFADCASPIAMLAIGLRFRFAGLRSSRRAILFAAPVKLLVMPLVWTTVAAMLGYRGALLCAVFLVHACPPATVCVAMADAMGCDSDLAGELVLVSTALSILTVFFGVVLLRAFALI